MFSKPLKLFSKKSLPRPKTKSWCTTPDPPHTKPFSSIRFHRRLLRVDTCMFDIYSCAQTTGKHHNLEWTYEGQLDSKGNFSGIGRMTFKHGGMYEGNLSLLVFRALFSDLCPPLRLSQESLPRSSGTAKEPCSCTTAPSTPVCYCRMPRSTYFDSSLITVFITGQFVKNNFHGYGTLMYVCSCCV